MQPSTSAHQPSLLQQAQHWMAHTVHWGDAPTWIAAVGGGVAAFYAFRTFRSQSRQVKDLAERQILSDQLVAYQARAYARALTAEVRVTWQDGPRPTERYITLHNESGATISEVSLTASLDGQTCSLSDAVDVLMRLLASMQSLTSLSGWALQEPTTLAESLASPVPPEFGRRWLVNRDGASADAPLAYQVQFTDEVGGRWTYDEHDRARLQGRSESSPRRLKP